MNEFRIILIIIGAFILVGVYLLGRRHSSRNSSLQHQHADLAHQSKAESSGLENASHSRTKTLGTKEIASSHYLDQEMLDEFGSEANAESVDWDNVGEVDFENLADSMEDVNYDQLIYQIGSGSSELPTGGHSAGFGGSSKPEKVFVPLRNTSNEKTYSAMNTAQNVESLVLVINIFARDNATINGEQLQSAMKYAGMHFGEAGLFHYYADPETSSEVQHKQSIFKIANAIEPGTFRKDGLDSLSTPGITCLMQLPCPVDAGLAFEKFYQTSKSLASKLNADLYDASRNKLTKQSLNNMKEQISEHSLKVRFSQSSNIH